MPSLKPNELEIMKILWDGGSLKPGDIQEKLSFPVKNSALRWQLAALVERGIVGRERRGKAYYYRAAAEREGTLKSLTRRMADVFCGGSAVALTGKMIEAREDWSEEDLEALRRFAEGKAGSKDSSEGWKNW